MSKAFAFLEDTSGTLTRGYADWSDTSPNWSAGLFRLDERLADSSVASAGSTDASRKLTDALRPLVGARAKPSPSSAALGVVSATSSSSPAGWIGLGPDRRRPAALPPCRLAGHTARSSGQASGLEDGTDTSDAADTSDRSRTFEHPPASPGDHWLSCSYPPAFAPLPFPIGSARRSDVSAHPMYQSPTDRGPPPARVVASSSRPPRTPRHRPISPLRSGATGPD